jgi:transposase
MGKRAELTQIHRSNIVLLSEEGYSTRAIAEKCHVAQSTVVRTLSRHSAMGNFASRSRIGRPMKTTARTDRVLRKNVLSNPFISAVQLKSTIQPLLDNVSARTIRHRLSKELKFVTSKPAKKPCLTTAARQKRLDFCKQHEKWSVNMWKKVMFSDESLFKQFDDKKQFVRYESGANRYDPKYTLKTVKHAPHIMVWGAFSAKGPGPLIFLPAGQMMNGTTYLHLLQENLPQALQAHNCTKFQQDSAPCHTSRIVKTWMQQQIFQVLPWPGNSPDINPIENLWNVIKQRLSNLKITSLEHLRHEISRMWTIETSPALCRRLVESMPKRMKAIIKNGGYPTKY